MDIDIFRAVTFSMGGDGYRRGTQAMAKEDKIPILEGLTEEQFEKLLSICQRMTVARSEVLIVEAQSSNDMFILTDGILVVSLWGKEINRIYPISPVGEMGLFTGEDRSATVTAYTTSTLLRITKDDLFDLFSKDKDLHIQFMLGMLIDVSSKLRVTNEVIARLKAKLPKTM